MFSFNPSRIGTWLLTSDGIGTFHSNKALVENCLRLYSVACLCLDMDSRLLVWSGDRQFSYLFYLDQLTHESKAAPIECLALAPSRTLNFIHIKSRPWQISSRGARVFHKLRVDAHTSHFVLPCTRSCLVVIYFAFTCETLILLVYGMGCVWK